MTSWQKPSTICDIAFLAWKTAWTTPPQRAEAEEDVLAVSAARWIPLGPSRITCQLQLPAADPPQFTTTSWNTERSMHHLRHQPASCMAITITSDPARQPEHPSSAT